MIPIIVIFIYLAVVLYIGIFAFRKGRSTGEDFFLASRSVGGVVFFLSLFATNMTAFAILGSSGKAYNEGIGVFGLMASSSALVIPLTLFFIGTRLWAHGKRFGHMTQVQFFRSRWECSEIGTVIFALSAAMLVPYIIISVIGGGEILSALSVVMGPDHLPVMEKVVHADGTVVMEAQHYISYEVGAAIVALVVIGNVFFGGMRGAVLVNVFQTILFLCFGAIACAVIGGNLEGGFSAVVEKMADAHSTLLTREKMPLAVFWSYTFIPLSSIMFPHMAIMCFTAKNVTAYKKTVVAYPLAIMALWLPCVFLGAIASADLSIHYADPARDSGRVLMDMLSHHAPVWLAGILGAGIMSAVMGSDCHQILALSTMFTKDVFDYYGGTKKFGEKGTVFVGRAFILLVNAVAYAIAIYKPAGIFDLAITYAFSGFAALAPTMLAALFWKRSTKYGALAATLFVGAAVAGVAFLENRYGPGSAGWQPGKGVVFWALGEGREAVRLLFLSPAGKLSVYGFMPVVPMVFGSAFCVTVASLLTKPPSQATIDKYFPPAMDSGLQVTLSAAQAVPAEAPSGVKAG
ncbi:MAG: sodium:solute symporter family protein [Planctomycetes bacterium]|nr:sodium:solute symporter family protein [Planctomycetota bacterium]